jgi:hypothetical protein
MITLEDVDKLMTAIQSESEDIIEISIGKCIVEDYPIECICNSCILNHHLDLPNNKYGSKYCFDLCKDKQFKELKDYDIDNSFNPQDHILPDF